MTSSVYYTQYEMLYKNTITRWVNENKMHSLVLITIKQKVSVEVTGDVI